MNACTRPLDWRDIDALATGGEPVVASDAAEHVLACPACSAAVESEAALTRELESIQSPPPSDDLSDRVLRLRRFSNHERWSVSLWGGPWLCSALLFAAGVLILAPGLAGSEQAGLLLAAAASAAAVLRAAVRLATDLAATAPAGLDALSAAARGDWTLAVAALALLLPAGLGLRRALARARR